jgi:glycosyltransferase involved in cell wall biosynthesis
MKKRYVLFLLNSLTLGGSERKVVAIATHLLERGLPVGCAWMRRPDTLLSRLPAAMQRWFLDRRSRISVRVLRQLRAIILQQGDTTLVGVNQYPALCAAVLGLILPRGVLRTICLMNTSTTERRRDFWFRPLYQWALRRMDVVVYGSKGQRELWDAPASRSWSRSRVIYNGVDLAWFDVAAIPGADLRIRQALDVPPQRFVFGTSGRLAPEKNHPVLIEALNRLLAAGVDAHLLIVGEGPERKRLEAMVTEFGLQQRISLIGQQDDVRPALAAMDVFVLPSTIETFSNAALEAMAMSRPILMSRVGGAAEMVSDGIDGQLLAPESIHDTLLDRLATLARDPQRREMLGRRARMRVMSQFSDATMYAAYRAIFTD